MSRSRIPQNLLTRNSALSRSRSRSRSRRPWFPIHDLSPSARATSQPPVDNPRPGVDFRGRPLLTRHGRSLALTVMDGRLRRLKDGGGRR